MQIYYKDSGVADFVYGKGQRFIEVNKNLKKYPYAYSKTIDHELQHANSKGVLDVWIELKQLKDIRLLWELLKFQVTNPKSLTSFLPISKTVKGQYSINWLYVLSYLVIISAVILI